MDLYELFSVCTAIFINDPPNWKKYNVVQKIQFLETYFKDELTSFSGDHDHGRGDEAAVDFKLIFAILTDSQLKDAAQYGKEDFLLDLGFEKVYTTVHSDFSRHQESGELNVYCQSLGTLNAKRKELIEKLKNLPPPPNELERRLSFQEFRLADAQRHNLYQAHFGNERLYRATRWPQGMGVRQAMANMVKEMTGGYDVRRDPEITADFNNLTWGRVKDQAIKYRNGMQHE